MHIYICVCVVYSFLIVFIELCNAYLRGFYSFQNAFVYFSIVFSSAAALGGERYEALPFSVRILLESAVRNCDGFRWVLAV